MPDPLEKPDALRCPLSEGQRYCDRLQEQVLARNRELEETVRRLEEMELRYRLVADYTYDWEYWEDNLGLLRYVSPSCLRITGYDVDEFISNPGLVQEIIQDEDRKIWAAHRHGMEQGTVTAGVEFRIRRKEGGLCWIEHCCQAVFDAEGRDIGTRASNRDITGRKLAETEAQRLLTVLTQQDRLALLDMLTATLAHEMSQPVAAGLLNAQSAQYILAADAPDVGAARVALDNAIANIRRASGVVRHVRSWLKKEPIERGLLPINRVIREIVHLLRPEFTNADVALELVLDEELPEIIGNRVQLQQVLANLLTNAVRILQDLPEGRRLVRVSTAKAASGDVVVRVRDSGPGVGPEKLETLFEPVLGTHADDITLGLPISRAIIDAHGGRLWVENAPDQGAIFSVALPIDPLTHKPTHHGTPDAT
jgi:PAS domain S-box-containing protein